MKNYPIPYKKKNINKWSLKKDKAFEMHREQKGMKISKITKQMAINTNYLIIMDAKSLVKNLNS